MRFEILPSIAMARDNLIGKVFSTHWGVGAFVLRPPLPCLPGVRNDPPLVCSARMGGGWGGGGDGRVIWRPPAEER